MKKRLARIRIALAKTLAQAFGRDSARKTPKSHTTGKRNLFADSGEYRSRRRSFSFRQHLNRIRSFSALLPRPVRERPEVGGALAIIGILLLASSVYLAGFSSYFRIAASRVVVERTDTLSDVNIAYKSLENAGTYGASIFTVNEDRIRSEITSLQPNVERVEVDRLYPQGLKIILSSSEPIFSTILPGEK
ncbi:MAG TPA: FtsQ-type POTRA domain-containing protein [bacterium]|nr:FtsQ-type POTRA domain-containing protein [bacterium]